MVLAGSQNSYLGPESVLKETGDRDQNFTKQKKIFIFISFSIKKDAP